RNHDQDPAKDPNQSQDGAESNRTTPPDAGQGESLPEAPATDPQAGIDRERSVTSRIRTPRTMARFPVVPAVDSQAADAPTGRRPRDIHVATATITVRLDSPGP